MLAAGVTTAAGGVEEPHPLRLRARLAAIAVPTNDLPISCFMASPRSNHSRPASLGWAQAAAQAGAANVCVDLHAAKAEAPSRGGDGRTQSRGLNLRNKILIRRPVHEILF